MTTYGRSRDGGGLRTIAAWSVAVILVMELVATGCGLRPDDEPQAISPSSLPPGLVATSSTVASGARTTIYLVTKDGGSPRLIARDVGVSTSPDAGRSRTEQAIEAVLQSSPQKTEQSFVNGTKLLGTQVEGDTLVINLGTFSVEGPAQAQALAQIVYTADAQGEFDRFRFLVNDKSVNIQLGDRTAEAGTVVSTADFAEFRPEATPSTPTSVTIGDS